MKTRIGKIARLPHEIREELNRRLYNGDLSPELLPWLNEQSSVQEVLRQFFDGSPINKQNLSDWRQGGYQDWLRHQERELRIQRISEEGAALLRHEDDDLFEDAARIAIAELMAAMDSLNDLNDEQRWDRLRSLTRELVRLQNGYNRSRWAELAWTRWNERFLGPYDYKKSKIPTEIKNTAPAQATEPHPSTLDPRPSLSPVKVDQAPSNVAHVPESISVLRCIHRPKGCDCICPHCHPLDGNYPLTEAAKDVAEAKERGDQRFRRENTFINVQFIECNCPCAYCRPSKEIECTPATVASEALAKDDQISNFKSEIPVLSDSQTPKPSNPSTPAINLLADFLRQSAHRKAAITVQK